jgi:hypothetical protein
LAGRGEATALLSGWAAAAAAAALIPLCPFSLRSPAGLLIATVSLTIAFRLMPRRPQEVVGPSASPLRSMLTRMGATAGLIVLLWMALAVLGPLTGGLLAALPTVVSVLVVFAHRERGTDAAISLLRGALAGIASFVGFCAVVASLLVDAGVATTFALGCLVGASLGTIVTAWPGFAGA